MVRCKFKCTSINDTEGGSQVRLEPVTQGSPENDAFFQMTPFGCLEMGLIDAGTANTVFQPGREFYVDLTPCE